jgi:hypothetical protein
VPDPVRSASPPLIEGSPVVGATLVSSIGDWAGTTPIVLTRRWQRCDPTGCADITGAYSDIYVVQAADLSKSIRLVVHATDDGGAATAASVLLGPVTTGAVPPPPTASVAGASSALGPTALSAAFNAPRSASLSRALAGRLKVRAGCTGPCRLLVRLRPSKAAARKWHVPRTIAAGKRTPLAAGAVTIRPRFAKKTRARLPGQEAPGRAHRRCARRRREAREPAPLQGHPCSPEQHVLHERPEHRPALSADILSRMAAWRAGQG